MIPSRLTLIIALGWIPLAGAADWFCLGGAPARNATAPQAPTSLANHVWTATPLTDEILVASASPVAYGGRVFVSARVIEDFTHVGNRLIALNRSSGARLWQRDLPPDTLQSWSSPALDVRNGVVIVASGPQLTGIDVTDGAVLWTTTFSLDIVNSSPCVSSGLTVSGTPANRLYVTTFAPFWNGALVAVNVDPYHATNNPYDPGDVVWSEPLFDVSGSTVAYRDGLLVVGTADGTLAAYDAVSGGSPLWSNDVSVSGFYGAVTLRGGYAYAATYNFSGASLLVKVDLADGSVEWTVACERTDSTPIVTQGGRIFLSAGIDGFGSQVGVQAFQDNGSSASLLWTTAGVVRVGGWTHHPLFSNGLLYVGEPPVGDIAAYVRLRILDTSLNPGDAGFVVDTLEGAGGSPCMTRDTLVSVGSGGVLAVRLTPLEMEAVPLDDPESGFTTTAQELPLPTLRR